MNHVYVAVPVEELLRHPHRLYQARDHSHYSLVYI